MPTISNDWADALKEEYNKEYYRELFNFVGKEYATHKIFPPGDDIFNAFHMTPLHEVKCVIIGQDPYHNDGQALGLSFSVKDGVEIPPSLVNIYKELHDDCGCYIPHTGNLTKWARQGVLMLNAVLTVRAHQANSHQGKGWEEFTDHVIAHLAQEREHLVFMLWGSYAKRKGAFIDRTRHLVLTAAHPSPLSANRGGFFGTHHFSRANDYLMQHGLTPIQW